MNSGNNYSNNHNHSHGHNKNNNNNNHIDSENENENENENKTITQTFYEVVNKFSILNFYLIHMYFIKLLYTCLVICFEP